MFKTWNQTVTVYSRNVDKQNRTVIWTRNVLHNCFVSKERIRDWNSHDAVPLERFIVRIPQACHTQDIFVPGNVVFIGEVDYTIDESADGLRMSERRCQYKDQCFEIKCFSDNTKFGFLPHYRVEG